MAHCPRPSFLSGPQDSSSPFRTQAVSTQMSESSGFTELAGQRKGMGWVDTSVQSGGWEVQMRLPSWWAPGL